MPPEIRGPHHHRRPKDHSVAEEKEKDSTTEPASESADPTPRDPAAAADDSFERGSQPDGPVELGSEADQADAFEPGTGPDSADPAGNYVGDRPVELAEDNGEAAPLKDPELVSVGAPREAAGKGSAAISPRTKKTKATPRQNRPVEKERRTGPVKFVKESVAELRKVVYPTGQQLLQYFVVVLIFVLFIIGIVSVLDLLFGWAIFQIFA
jgi:preprotein translocase subunit SecE